METSIRILDFLPAGRASDRGYSREPVAIAVGETELKLLEVVPRPGATLATGESLPLVPAAGGPPAKVDHVRRRIGYDELTTAARTELPEALAGIVRADPAKYLRVFNEAPAVSRRFHLLELLPGIGKKTMQLIVEERRRSPFASFAEIEARTHVKAPETLIAGRIEEELRGAGDKYRLFVVA